MMYLKVLCVLVIVQISLTKSTTRESEGFPVGYLSDCPGSNKEARISPNSLRNLKLIVVHDRNVITAFFYKTSYNYYQMKSLAKHLDFKKKTVLKVIGYLDSNYMTGVGSIMGSVYKSLGYNVLLLEYNAFSTFVYPKAARFLRPVGKHTAEMLAELTKLGLDPKKLELIGLSHGGQAVSFIAKNYRQITGMNVSRVTSLDPGGPCFRHNGPDERIDASDADFVDVVHTNIDGYGMAGAVGHIDYYVNGGEFQPGDFMTLPCTSFCSHTRSYTLWLGALFNPSSLIAMQCDSIQDARDRKCFDKKPLVTNVLGLNVNKTTQGIFYLPTHNSFPYTMGVSGLKNENEAITKHIGQFNEDDVLIL